MPFRLESVVNLETDDSFNNKRVELDCSTYYKPIWNSNCWVLLTLFTASQYQKDIFLYVGSKRDLNCLFKINCPETEVYERDSSIDLSINELQISLAWASDVIYIMYFVFSWNSCSDGGLRNMLWTEDLEKYNADFFDFLQPWAPAEIKTFSYWAKQFRKIMKSITVHAIRLEQLC